MCNDQVVVSRHRDGYDCIVGGVRYGTWRSRSEAEGEMQVEQRRLAEREALAHMLTETDGK